MTEEQLATIEAKPHGPLVDDMIAEIRRGWADTRRLGWLDEHFALIGWEDSGSGAYVRAFIDGFVLGQGSTLREAIDAAMQASEAGAVAADAASKPAVQRAGCSEEER